MLARLSYRSLVILIAAIVLLSLITFPGWRSSYRTVRVTSSKTGSGLFRSHVHGLSKPSPGIKTFWVKWSRIFYDSRPTADHIVVKTQASTANSDQANGERNPSKTSLHLPQSVVDSLRASHKSHHDRGAL